MVGTVTATAFVGDGSGITGVGDILADGSVAWTGADNHGGNLITNVADPVAAQDVATKAYGDANWSGGGGGGSISGKWARVDWRSADLIQPNVAYAGDYTNATLGMVEQFSEFDKGTKSYFDFQHTIMPDNFNSNVLYKLSISTLGTTNLTKSMGIVYKPDGVNSFYWLTNSLVTLTTDTHTNQQQVVVSTNLANAVAGRGIYWSVFMDATNAAGQVDATILSREAECLFIAE